MPGFLQDFYRIFIWVKNKMANLRIKKQHGIYYTNVSHPFAHRYFVDWAKKIEMRKHVVLEPFAGANHIIDALQKNNLCNEFASFDISPQSAQVIRQDTISQFPKGYNVCVTNPPWLYKSRAKRLRLQYPNTKWDNLYKYCLEICLENCHYVAVLIPASFLSSNIFLERLDSLIFIQSRLFIETENPVCLALFNKENIKNTDIFADDLYLGTLTEMEQYLPKKQNNNVKFNIPDGELGLIGIDNTKEASIRFCKGQELKNYNIKYSSRSITRISVDGVFVNDETISQLNTFLNHFRGQTHDIFMTAFKGLRDDGMYRRRLDYSLARNIIGEIL